MNDRVVVIGGGPAGMMAALAAAGAGKEVILLEQLKKSGAKLLATGGGRCNLTNRLNAAEWPSKFVRGERFVRASLSACSNESLLSFFEGQGVNFHAEDGFHYFPVSEMAGDVVHAMNRALVKAGVEKRVSEKGVELIIDGGGREGSQDGVGRD